MTDQYAVVGNPVAHSKSPQIHAAFARAEGQDIDYRRLESAIGAFAQTASAFRASGGKGLNVTVPFKHEAFALASELSARAQLAGAVNVLSFDGTACRGDNTDGAGLVRDISANLNRPLRGQRLLLLGAGGAASGVIGPLLQAAPCSLTIANRSIDKAQALVARYAAIHGSGSLSATLEACGYAALAGRRFDVVINATSTGLTDAMPPLPDGLYAAAALAYDMVYGRDTPFMRHARAAGAIAADGLGMLVEQAAESFLIWRGVRPATVPLIAALRRGELA